MTSRVHAWDDMREPNESNESTEVDDSEELDEWIGLND